MDARFIYMTAASREEAERIGRELVESRLAACVNIIDGMSSMYWWNGQIESSKEAVLIAKTIQSKTASLIERVKSMHSYSCPCVISLPVVDGNLDYLRWIASESSSEPQPS